MKSKFHVVILFVLTLHFPTWADIVVLQSGQVVTGTVLQQDGDGTLLKLEYGTFRYLPFQVKDVRKESAKRIVATQGGQRIRDWGSIVETLAKEKWAHELKQIPATVIDTGVLHNVPYISFRCNSEGYEINIYGDLDDPAGVEIGTLNYLLKNEEAKSNCAKFIAAILVNDDDKEKIRTLNIFGKDVKQFDGLTFETTLPSEPDSYGGWWISVYDPAALGKARASGKELLAITEPRLTSKPQAAITPTASLSPNSLPAWSSSDLSFARPTLTGPSGGDGGSVYVRGYYRKDGTYVHAYTRSYPHRR